MAKFTSQKYLRAQISGVSYYICIYNRYYYYNMHIIDYFPMQPSLYSPYCISIVSPVKELHTKDIYFL